MPIDPTISLAAGQGLQAPQSILSGVNPADSMLRFAQVQNALNQNRLFQQEFGAKQVAGEIISSAPDMATAQQRLLGDPRTAAFAGSIINTMRQLDLTNAQIAQTQAQTVKTSSEVSASALGQFLKMMPTIYNDPNQWAPSAKAVLSTIPPGAQQTNSAAALESIREGLFHNVPVDPAGSPMGMGAVNQFRQNAMAMMLPTISPEMLSMVTGAVRPQITDVPSAMGATSRVVVGGVGNTLAGPPSPNRANSPLAATGSPGIGGPTAGVVLGTGPGTEKQQEMSGYGKIASDIAEDMSARQENLPENIRRLDIMNQAIGQAQLGGWANFRGEVGRFLQGARNAGASWIPQSTIESIANSSLSGTQLFDAEVKPLLLAQLKEVAAGRFLKPEVEGYFQAMSSTTDPRVVMDLLNQARYALQTGYNQAQAYPQFKDLLERGDPSVRGLHAADFFAWWNKTQARPGGYPQVTPGGMNLSPTTPQEVMGLRSPPPANPLTAPPPAAGNSDMDAIRRQVFGH